MYLHLQNIILEMIARGKPVQETARRLCVEAEILAPDRMCSLLRVDRSGRLTTLAAPSLPVAYCEAIEGVEMGPNVGSCGTAAYLRQPVSVCDIANDPLWAPYRELAQTHNLGACWSSPIIGKSGRVVGTFAFYSRTPQQPSQIEREIVASSIYLAAIAIERGEAEEESRKLAYCDTITGLENRASFNLALASIGPVKSDRFGILLADVDRLKLVNDRLGHAGGDDLIRETGRRIGAALPGERSFRLSGDEFAVIFEGPQAGARLEAAARAITRAMEPPMTCNGRPIQAALTLGGAVSPEGGVTVEALRQSADFALYHAKEKNRGGFVKHNRTLGASIAQRFAAIEEVGAAIDEDRIEPFYQPIVLLETEEVVGVEALCRMRTRQGEIVAAANFAQALTDDVIATRVTERMVSKIAGDVRDWLDDGIPFQHVGVNVTTSDFLRGDLVERISSMFRNRGVSLDHVVLEVTESVYINGEDMLVAESVKALRRNGLLVALDDFGTGYASLTHLLTFPVDIIKIDRAFVDGLTRGGASAAIVEGLLDIARKLGIKIVAEGIETATQADILRQFGCLLGQGYHYAKPLDRVRMTRLLKRRAQPMDRLEVAKARLTAA